MDIKLSKGVKDIGKPVVKPIPFVLGFSGFDGADIQKCQIDFEQKSLDEFISYMKEKK